MWHEKICVCNLAANVVLVIQSSALSFKHQIADAQIDCKRKKEKSL